MVHNPVLHTVETKYGCCPFKTNNVVRFLCIFRGSKIDKSVRKSKQTHILPVFLQQRYQEVDTELHILENLLLLHSTVSNGNAHAKNFLELELDHCFGFINFGLQGFLMTHQSRKFSCRAKPYSGGIS